MSILIGADFVPTESNIDLFCEGKVEELFGDELLKEFQAADFRIFNLETPLTDHNAPISKCGPCLSAPTKCIKGYVAAGVDLVTLANNHIMDQGENGLTETVKVLQKYSIRYVGVGKTINDCISSCTITIKGKKIGIYACAEHEFSIATTCLPGANPFDPLESYDRIKEMAAEHDYIIVLYHGGKELYQYPSPNLQKVCRKFIESGANLVICQHSHCIGCEEEYKSGSIIYGQGNFLFDRSNHYMWRTGLVVKIQDDFSVNLLPIIKIQNKVRLASVEQTKEILSQYYSRSEEITKEHFINEEYSKFARNQIARYINTFGGGWRSILVKIERKVFNHNPDIKKYYGSKRMLRLINHIECEAHRELIIEGLRQYF